MKNTLEQIAKKDGRYDPRAFAFVYEGLGATVKHLSRDSSGNYGEPFHISGKQLSLGLRDLAVDKFGYLAKYVLGYWGIRSTGDFGEIVYLMIEHGWMSAQENDRLEDFGNVFDFDQAFVSNFRIH